MTQDYHFVLIRGLLPEARHWGEFAGYLQQNFPGASMETPNIPGNGCLNYSTSPNTVTDMTEALRRQVDKRQRLTLIAISMGGMIAIDWMSRYPSEVNAAVLINASARPLSPFYHRMRWRIYPCVVKMIMSTALNRETDILELTSNRFDRDSHVLKS